MDSYQGFLAGMDRSLAPVTRQNYLNLFVRMALG